jgi:hypothetical protein
MISLQHAQQPLAESGEVSDVAQVDRQRFGRPMGDQADGVNPTAVRLRAAA